jgi:hypothetical protein
MGISAFGHSRLYALDTHHFIVYYTCCGAHQAAASTPIISTLLAYALASLAVRFAYVMHDE